MPVHALSTLKMVILVHSGARVGVYQGASKAEESGAERMEDGRKRVRQTMVRQTDNRQVRII